MTNSVCCGTAVVSADVTVTIGQNPGPFTELLLSISGITTMSTPAHNLSKRLQCLDDYVSENLVLLKCLQLMPRLRGFSSTAAGFDPTGRMEFVR